MLRQRPEEPPPAAGNHLGCLGINQLAASRWRPFLSHEFAEVVGFAPAGCAQGAIPMRTIVVAVALLLTMGAAHAMQVTLADAGAYCRDLPPAACVRDPMCAPRFILRIPTEAEVAAGASRVRGICTETCVRCIGKCQLWRQRRR